MMRGSPGHGEEVRATPSRHVSVVVPCRQRRLPADAPGDTMDLEALALGLIGIGAGSLLAMFGVRFFWILLTAWGAIIGFLVGADIASAIFGDGFLATAAGWIAGIAGAVALGLVAGSLFWAAIVFLCGGVGYAIGSGIVIALGFDPGLLSVVAGLAAGIGFIVIAVLLRAPIVLIAILTSFAGAGYAIVGALLILGRASVGDLEGGALGALRDRPLAIAAWLAMGALACAYQLMSARETELKLLGALDQPQPGAPAQVQPPDALDQPQPGAPAQVQPPDALDQPQPGAPEAPGTVASDSTQQPGAPR
jgi:hypothetical protein